MIPSLRNLLRRRVNTIRIGSDYDGWLIPSGLLRQGSVCYCAGAGEDISFDVELAKRFSAEVVILDPTPRAIEHFEKLTAAAMDGVRFPINNSSTVFYDVTPSDLQRIRFLPLGLWEMTATVTFFGPQNSAHVSHSILNLQTTDSGFEAPVRRLSQVMKSLGHNHIDLLKLDIEGAEGVVLGTLLDDRLDVLVICVEFDEAVQSKTADAGLRLDALVRRIEESGYIKVDMDQAMNGLFVRTDVAERLRKAAGSIRE